MGKFPGARPISLATETNGWAVPGILIRIFLSEIGTRRGPTWAQRVLANASENRKTRKAALLKDLEDTAGTPVDRLPGTTTARRRAWV
jgi:hypothetical protein